MAEEISNSIPQIKWICLWVGTIFELLGASVTLNWPRKAARVGERTDNRNSGMDKQKRVSFANRSDDESRMSLSDAEGAVMGSSKVKR